MGRVRLIATVLLLSSFTNNFSGNCLADANFGTTLYSAETIAGKWWTDGELVELQCRIAIGSLVPTKMPRDLNAFMKYFALIKNNTARIGSTAAKKHAMIMVADAIGGYLNARVLPEVTALYYEGAVDYSTAKRFYDLDKKIKYVLGTDGRGWARPEPAAKRGGPSSPAVRPAELVSARPAGKRCGGVDASPYGLVRHRLLAEDEDFALPFFDHDGRPGSVVVPWLPGRPVLYGVREAGCYRALFNHCARVYVRAVRGDDGTAGRMHLLALRAWLNRTVAPLVAAVPGRRRRLYPALWGASAIVRHIERAAAAIDRLYLGVDRPGRETPNHNFYLAVVLASMFVAWTSALCATISGHRTQPHTVSPGGHNGGAAGDPPISLFALSDDLGELFLTDDEGSVVLFSRHSFEQKPTAFPTYLY